MRRRRRGRLTSPDEIAAAYARALAEVDRRLPDRSDPRRRYELSALLVEEGTDVVEAIRARRLLRRLRSR